MGFLCFYVWVFCCCCFGAFCCRFFVVFLFFVFFNDFVAVVVFIINQRDICCKNWILNGTETTLHDTVLRGFLR